jgi:PEP-CTERM motif
MMKTLPKTILAVLAIGLLSCGLLTQQAQAQIQGSTDLATPAAGPIIGNITFAGTVSLDTLSTSNATMVTAWHGLSTTPSAGLPQVQSHDGSFNGFVTDGDGTVFHAPWSFNSGPISSFWSVDGFTFDLITSTIVSQTGSPGSGALHVAGTGTVSGNGFTTSSGTWNFTTQDPSASSQFSFSAASAVVPEPSSVFLSAIGLAAIVALKFSRKPRF